MSIYATLGRIGVCPDIFWDEDDGNGLVGVWIQGVPSFIGHPAPGYGYEAGDPYADFLPPPTDAPDPEADDVPRMRAVVFVDDDEEKDGQRYVNPLLVLTGAEYAAIPFDELLERLTEAVRTKEERGRIQAS